MENSSDFNNYGHKKINHVLDNFKEQITIKNKKNNDYILTSQTTSVGNIDKTFLQGILPSFFPNSLSFSELKEKFKEMKKKKVFDEKNKEDIAKSFKMIYPTQSYIEKDTFVGEAYAGPLFFSKKLYEKESFPKNIFYKFGCPEQYSYHFGLIPHLKVCIVTYKDMEINDDTIILFGSHNFTAAAFGKYEKDCSQFTIMNTELSCLYPPLKGFYN